MSTQNTTPSWSDLPQELLYAIANSLTPNPIDIFAFRSVCNSWRASFPRPIHPSLLSPPLPLTLPRPPYPDSNCVKTPAPLSVTIIYALRHPHLSSSSSSSFFLSPSWFSFLDEYTPAKLHLHKLFPSYSCSHFTFPKSVSLVEFSRLELGRFYNLSYKYNHYKSWTKNVEVSKVVLFPNRFAVIALFDAGTLWMFMLDLGFSEWEIVHDAEEFCFDDIVEFKGRVLGVDRRGTLYEITYDSSNMNVVVPPIARAGGRRKRLVDSLGMLYLIVGFDADPTVNELTKITKFTVYELNEEKKEWFPVSSIGERSFFVGFNFSFSASAKELATCGKNCVFFKEHSFRSYSINSHYYSVTQLLSSSEHDIRVYHLNDDIRVGEIGSYPGYSDVLWPPPSWIWGVDRLKRLEILETPIDEMLANYAEAEMARFKNPSFQINTRGPEGELLMYRDRRVMDVLKLKEVINMFQDGDTKYVDLENKLQEPISTHGLREFIYMLDQIDNQLVQARTCFAGTVPRLGWPNELETALEHIDTRDAAPLHLLRHVLRKHDVLLFRLEEFVSAALSHPDTI